MARIRTIKPEFCVSEQVIECSINARLLFVLMWMHCDDHGNHPAKLMQLKAECFPCDPFTKDDMAAMVGELVGQGLLVEYIGSDGATYWHVTGWQHQLINRRGDPKYPAFTAQSLRTHDDSVNVHDDSVNVHDNSVSTHDKCVSVHGGLTPEGKGREGKGEEGKGKELTEASASCAEQSADAAASAPADGGSGYRFPTKGKGKARQWELPAAKLAEYQETFVGLDVAAELRKARQWLSDNPTKRKTPSGMVRFLTGWLTRANDDRRGKFQSNDEHVAAERKRHLAAEASRREAAEQAARARASPSEFASGVLRRVDNREASDEAARRELQAKLGGA